MVLGGAGVIKFPTTPVPSIDPNTLDDYEEGTWTGVLGMHSTYTTTSGVPNVTTSALGRYTKVGQLCQISIYFDVTAYSNHVAYNITGLPFTSGSSGNGYPLAMGHQRGIRFVYATDIITDHTQSATVGVTSTQINLQGSHNGTAYSGWYYISNEPTQSKYISVNGVYVTAV